MTSLHAPVTRPDARRGAESPARRRWILGTFAGVVLGPLSSRAADTRYPSRPVRFIVGQAPGGPSDTIARLVAKEFAERLKEAVVVENHGGATGTIAGRMVAQAPADGYTLLVASNGPIASAPVELEAAGYDPLRAWAPVGRIARAGYVLAVRSGLGTANLREFVTLARARAESVSLATVGAGSNSARALALLQRAAGIRILNVPYNGGALGLQAVVAGHVDATFCDVALALPFAASGAVRLLGACARQRLALAPDVQTFAEAGFPGVVTEAWYGIVAPAGTPAGTIAELVATLHSTLADAEVRRRFTAMGFEGIVETPAEFADAIRAEVEQVHSLAERAIR
jgi:tripartite-type tricarboxylate transporter receptor subunit TctC